MRIEIEISEEEAAFLRKWYDDNVSEADHNQWARFNVRLARSLPPVPRPIQVGDTVKWGQCTYPVLAIWKQWAWVGDDDAGPYSVPLKNLTLLSRGEL